MAGKDSATGKKDDPTPRDAAGKPPVSSTATTTSSSVTPSTTAPTSSGIQVLELTSKSSQFIISPKRAAGDQGLRTLANAGGNLIYNLKTYSGIEAKVVGSRPPRSRATLTGLSTASATQPAVLLVEMDEAAGKQLMQQSLQTASSVWVDQNRKIQLAVDPLSMFYSTSQAVFNVGGGRGIDIQVLGEADSPLQNAKVSIYTNFQIDPFSARTDQNGVATFQLSGFIPGAARAIVVEPITMHWNRVVRNPELQIGVLNRLRLRSYVEHDPRLRTRGSLSWGVERLGIIGKDNVDGSGVKIGIIDTGCDASHDMLGHIKYGVDFNASATPTSWQNDEVGHGTHVAGIIAALSSKSDFPARGMAPGAEICIYKVFPQGDFFVLGAAIEAAVADQVDVINMSLGSRDISNDIIENIQIARDAGIACFVAAGNSADDVQFPANISSAFAVSAVGLSMAVPDDSAHANTPLQPFITPDGYFSPAFTCHGTSVDFGGPGVGVISTVPQNGLSALDGTSMATPHLAGLAALYLQQDPQLRSAQRNSSRVDLLFERMRKNVLGLPFGTARVGAGVPTYSEAVSSSIPVSASSSGQRLMIAWTPTGLQMVHV